MRAFLALTLAVLIAVGIGVGAVAAGAHGAGGISLRSLRLPAGIGSRQLFATPDGLAVSGTVGPNGRCVSATLSTSSDSFSPLASIPETHPNSTLSACGTEVAPDVWLLSSYQRGTFNVEMRLAIRDARSGRVREGPVVASLSTWGRAHDGQPAAADGSVWLYDDEAKPMSVLQLSETTGRVLARVPLPGLGYDPVTAADDDGLWIAPSQGWASYPHDTAPIDHVAPGAYVATVVHRGGSAVQWLTAWGHTMWADVVGPLPTLTQTIWRFDGPTAKVAFATPSSLLPGPEGNGTGYAVVGNATDGLYTVKGNLQAPFEGDDCAGTVSVIRISPSTGAQRIVDTFSVRATTPWVSCENESLFSPWQAAVTNGTLSFLFDVTPHSALDFTTLRQLTLAPK